MPELDEEQIKQHALGLARHAVRQEEIAAMAQRNAVAARAIVSGYVEMYPDLRPQVERIFGGELAALERLVAATEAEKVRPRGAEAVSLILQEKPGEQFAVSELVKGLRDRGWLPESENPANAVRTALERLVADSTADVRKHRYRTGRGTYSVSYSYDPDTEGEDYSDFGEEPF
jgi:hypothetical protein